MDDLLQFYERHRNFIVSTLFASFGVAIALYSVMITGREAWIHHIHAARLGLAKETNEINRRIEVTESKAEESAETAAGIKSLPDFLRRINAIARGSNVILRELSPDEEDPLRFTITFIDTYYKFLEFASSLESLDVSIHDIQIHPYDLGSTPPLHVVVFSLTPRADAEPLSSDRLNFLKRRVSERDKRNPFQRFAFNEEAEQIRPEVDLTWVYKLSGIGRIGDRDVATINGRDYFVDEVLDGMTIKTIQSDRVYLEQVTENGTSKFQLKFRRIRKGDS